MATDGYYDFYFNESTNRGISIYTNCYNINSITVEGTVYPLTATEYLRIAFSISGGVEPYNYYSFSIMNADGTKKQTVLNYSNSSTSISGGAIINTNNGSYINVDCSYNRSNYDSTYSSALPLSANNYFSDMTKMAGSATGTADYVLLFGGIRKRYTAGSEKISGSVTLTVHNDDYQEIPEYTLRVNNVVTDNYDGHKIRYINYKGHNYLIKQIESIK